MAIYAEAMDSSERFEYTECESFHEAIDEDVTLGYTPGIYSPERFEHTSNNFSEPANDKDIPGYIGLMDFPENFNYRQTDSFHGTTDKEDITENYQ